MKSKSTSDLSMKDTVILHCIERGKTLPSISPFVLKLETFLRMFDIPYQIDHSKAFNPKSGKTPWISLNGQDMTDSQLIIEFLTEKFEKDVWGNATPEDKALLRSVRIMLEEHFFWGMAQWRFTGGINTFPDLQNISGLKFRAMKLLIPGRIKKMLHAQGLGRHPTETVVKLTGDDLRNVSTLLGTKMFILGDNPTETDAAIFGFLAQGLWGCPGSPYENIITKELPNLKEYCLRMKEKFWSDQSDQNFPNWDDCLFKK